MTSKSEKLAIELFALVERDQGKAFISDGMGALSTADIYEAARTSLIYSESVVRNLRKWLKRHGQLHESRERI